MRGVRRKLDDLGRLVIAKEIRKEMGWKEREMLEMIPVIEGVLIKKAEVKLTHELKDFSTEQLLEEVKRRTFND